MKRILQVVAALDGGGVETLLKNYYEVMDQQAFRFDFIVHGRSVGALEAYWQERGSRIWHIPPKTRNYPGNLRQMRRIIRRGDYDIIHCHQDINSAYPLYFAARAGIPVRIAHAHSRHSRKPFYRAKQRLLWRRATHLLACSEAAAVAVFGPAVLADPRYCCLPNAIDTARFRFDPAVRARLRARLDCGEALVIGHIGRFVALKNQAFLLECLAALRAGGRDVRLVLVGDGPLRREVEEQAAARGLSRWVCFAGHQAEVSPWLQALDVFVLPSRSEGFGLTLLEAQCAGLPCLAAKGSGAEAANVSGTVDYLDLAAGAAVWAQAILHSSHRERRDGSGRIAAAGYSLTRQAERLGSEIYG